MRKWVSAAAVMPLFWAAAAQAQAMKGLLAVEVAAVARNRELDLRLYQQQGIEQPSALIRGMLVQQGVGDNAFLGVGLAETAGGEQPGEAAADDDDALRHAASVAPSSWRR